MDICILNYTGAQCHLGCQTSSYILEKELRRRFEDEINFERVHSTDQNIGCKVPESKSDFSNIIEGILLNSKFVSPLKQADLVVLNGEGTLHWPTNNNRVWYWLACVEVAKQQFNLPVWVVNAAFYSDNNLFLSFCARTLQNVDFLATRDPGSFETMKKIGLDNAVQASDLTFLTPSRIDADIEEYIAAKFPSWRKNKTERKIIFAGSSAIGGQTRSQWVDSYSAIIEELAHRYGSLSILFITQLGMGGDVKLGQELALHYDCIKCIGSDFTPSEAVWLTRQADVVISGRFHVNAMAVIAGTPAIMLPGNTPKNESLAKMAESSNYRFVNIEDVEHVISLCGKFMKRKITSHNENTALRKRMSKLAVKNFPVVDASELCSDEGVDLAEYIRQTEFIGRSCHLREMQRIDRLEQQAGKRKEQIDKLKHQKENLEDCIQNIKLQRDSLKKRIQEIEESRKYRYACFAATLYHSMIEPRTLWKRLLRGRFAEIKKLPSLPPKKDKFHDAELKILHVSLTPLAGAPIRMCRLLDQSRYFSAISVCLRNWYPDRRTFDYDIVYNPASSSKLDHESVKRLINDCDIIHFHNEAYFKPFGVFKDIADNKPICLQWHSGPDAISDRLNISIEEAEKWQELPTLVVAQKQARFYPNSVSVPNVVDIRLPEYQATERSSNVVEICFSPTDEVAPNSLLCGDKGDDRILEALRIIGKRHPDKVRIKIVRGVPLDECLAAKQQCHICIDDIKSGGYHLSSLEGLALGCVTIANLDSVMENFLADYVGCQVDELPWYKANEENIVERLEELIANKELINELGLKSRLWMEHYWNHEFVLGKMRQAYEHIFNR